MGTTCALHINPSQPHQRIIGEAMARGLQRHGLLCNETMDRTAEADYHVVIGPWYALDHWRDHPRVLYVDRAYWGDPRFVSVHWLRDGEKHFTACDDPRKHPDLHAYRNSEKVIYLCDYQQAPRGLYDGVRYHPAERRGGRTSLLADLAGYGIAAGGRTTALVTAAIFGLMVRTDDEYSPVAPISGFRHGRETWINRLAWHNWGVGEIERGDAWQYLKP